MPVTTRHQVGNGNHTSFVFQQLETPPKRSRKQLCDHNLESVQTQTVNVRHNPLYSFENPFGTPSKTSNDTSNIVNMVHPNEIKRRLEEQARETQRTLDAIYATEEKTNMLALVIKHTVKDIMKIAHTILLGIMTATIVHRGLLEPPWAHVLHHLSLLIMIVMKK